MQVQGSFYPHYINSKNLRCLKGLLQNLWNILEEWLLSKHKKLKQVGSCTLNSINKQEKSPISKTDQDIYCRIYLYTCSNWWLQLFGYQGSRFPKTNLWRFETFSFTPGITSWKCMYSNVEESKVPRIGSESLIHASHRYFLSSFLFS